MKMEEVRTSTIFFLLAMDGLPVEESSDARNAVIRAYHGAVSLEEGEMAEVVIPRAGRLFRKTIISEEKKALERAGELLDQVDSLKMLTVDALFGHSREKVYRADENLFEEASKEILESVRSGNVSEKTAFLIWLLREAGCLPEFLPRDDLERLGDTMGTFPLWTEFIGKKLELGEKRRVESYPECERFEDIFIENILLKGDDRKKTLLEYIEKGGHEVREMDDHFLIDNRAYSVRLDVTQHGRIERKGALLQRMI